MSNLITITTQPVGKIILKNSTDTLTVAATALAVDPDNNYTLTGDLKYEWYKNNVIVLPPPAGWESSFTPSPTSVNASYYVDVIAKYTNPANTSQSNTVKLKSDEVTLTIIDRPVLAEEQPGLKSREIKEGTSTSLYVDLIPSPNNTAFYYQWYEGASGLESNPIANATNPFYTTPNLTTTTTYWVKAYNLYKDYANSINSPSVRVGVVLSIQNTREANINKINNITGGKNGDKLIDLDLKQISSDFADEVVQIEAQKLLEAFPSIPNIPGAGVGVYLNNVLNDFDEAQIRIVSQAQTLADCAKDIPQRLINMGVAIVKKLLLNLISNITGIALADLIALANALARIVEIADQFIMNVVSAAVGAVTEVVAGAFAAASDALGELVDICNNFPYNTETGNRLLRPTNIPTGRPPSGVIGVLNPVGNSFYSSEAKDEYDEFMFNLKEYTVPNSALSSLDRDNYNSSLSYLNAITRAYHDKISKTIDNSLDARHQREFNASINDTLDKNTLWPSYIKLEFKNKADVISEIINDNAQVIRNFLGESKVTSGIISTGVTTYSGPESDYTTFLDIKTAQRPPELVEKYKNRRESNLPDGSLITNSLGKTFKIGTLNYSDAFNGAYGGALVSDRSVASTRFPGGSILALKNPDGSAYNPTGRNSSGQYIVDDTGNAELTYEKVDIFTTTPEIYKNIDKVQVYLVKEGLKRDASQYKNALAAFGKGY